MLHPPLTLPWTKERKAWGARASGRQNANNRTGGICSVSTILSQLGTCFPTPCLSELGRNVTNEYLSKNWLKTPRVSCSRLGYQLQLLTPCIVAHPSTERTIHGPCYHARRSQRPWEHFELPGIVIFLCALLYLLKKCHIKIWHSQVNKSSVDLYISRQ